MTKRRTFSKEFKLEAVRLAQESGNVTGTARDLGIASSALWRWKKAVEEDQEQAFPGKGNPRDRELAELRREVARLKEEREILKKAMGIFTSRPR